MSAAQMLLNGFFSVLMPENLIYIFGGVLVGMVLGAIPGLTATMAIALVIPLTYYMTPTQSLIMLLAAYNAGTFGGSISAVLIGTPGTPAAAATVADGHALALKGKPGKAIKTALFSSAFGCLFSSVVLILIAQPIAKYALKFGPAEYTIPMIFSLSIIASASGRSLAKGLICGCIGLFFCCVGMDPQYTIPRLNFGILKLSSGIDLVVMLIGALTLGEILTQVEGVAAGNTSAQLPPMKTKDDRSFTRKDLKSSILHWFRSSAIDKRREEAPDVPTLQEMGYDTTCNSYMGLCAPAGIPDEVQQLRDAFAKASEDATYKEILANSNLTWAYMTGDEYETLVRDMYQEFGEKLG